MGSIGGRGGRRRGSKVVQLVRWCWRGSKRDEGDAEAEHAAGLASGMACMQAGAGKTLSGK